MVGEPLKVGPSRCAGKALSPRPTHAWHSGRPPVLSVCSRPLRWTCTLTRVQIVRPKLSDVGEDGGVWASKKPLHKEKNGKNGQNQLFQILEITEIFAAMWIIFVQ